MSASSFGFTSWGRRAPSVVSEAGSEDVMRGRTLSPGRVTQGGLSDARLLSSSVSSSTHREPTRSFIPGSIRDHLSPVDSAGYARSVREDTAELASYILSDKRDKRGPSFLARQPSSSFTSGREPTSGYDIGDSEERPETSSDTIQEVSEPPSPEHAPEETPEEGPSLLSTMLKHPPPEVEVRDDEHRASPTRLDPSFPKYQSVRVDSEVQKHVSETTPLLQQKPHPPLPLDSPEESDVEELEDIEGQKPRQPPWYHRLRGSIRDHARGNLDGAVPLINRKTWDGHTMWQRVVMDPVRCLPAVIVGLLLNILDALSYGMILFPLSAPVFADLGPAGISIFYVSTIISQLTFSCGSIFRGGIGSELIEVVPFFHSMAATITSRIGEDQPDAVIATTITSFAVSSMLTGVVFFLMGKFKVGYIVGFIPRHILIGCIGGVGWFLVQTGFEVSARIEEFQYDWDTAQRLVKLDTLPLWLIPLVLAGFLFGLQRKITSQYFLPSYILCIPLVFYFFVVSIDTLNPERLRKSGWIFESPPAGQPWWYFWTLYRFDLIHWGALLETVGAMFALTFFSLLHVPINVPALAQTTGEDNADLNHELKLHGYSNFLSGMAGSIQNYLVYANTVFFFRSGGDSRLAGFMLAALTAVILVIGPAIIGFIPVMMVGTLIFVLGFELMTDALVAPRKKLKVLEYLTIVAIVLTMGIYDFVVGIFLGIVLAFISVVVSQSGISAVRATYTGAQVGSMVRRNPSQHHYLKEVGSQTYIIKLNGNLFFGTIVGVQEKIRDLIAEKYFASHPIKYLIIDLWQVTDIDYSAAEGFMTVSRLLDRKGVSLLVSGQDADGKIGRDLRAVGLGSDGIEVKFMPDLNSALESCENEQLKTFYAHQEAMRVTRPSPSSNLDVPARPSPQPLELLAHSPRQDRLHEVARNVLTEQEVQLVSRWRGISEPLRLMLQIFHDISDKNEDFWFRATPYFTRKEFVRGIVLYHRGDPAKGFYLLERGELRADYDTPQGRLSEPIVQGTTCGELPFFSQTDRTATVVCVRDCVVWVMDTTSWKRLQTEQNDVYQELLSVSLKLTGERMNAMTNYTLASAT